MDIKVLTNIAQGLNIPMDRQTHIISYIDQMIRDYRDSSIDITKEIYLNLKGNEIYFAMFIIGDHFSPIFYRMDDLERADFLTLFADVLGFSNERVGMMADYMKDKLKKEMKENVPVIDMMKGIIDSKFTDKEKGYMLFIFALVLE